MYQKVNVPNIIIGSELASLQGRKSYVITTPLLASSLTRTWSYGHGFQDLPLSLGSNSSALSRSIPFISVGVNPPFSIKPFATMAAVPPPNG